MSSDSSVSSHHGEQRALVARADTFHWLLDTHFVGAHSPQVLEAVRMVSVSPTGGLTIRTSTLARPLLYESSCFFGTYKEWICPIMSYPVINPTRTYKFVS